MEKNEKTKLINFSEIKKHNEYIKKEINEIELRKSGKINQKVRYHILDNFKGILIFKVVLGHFLLHYSNYHMKSTSRIIVVFIYFYHMQAFVFISGFLTTESSTKIINTSKLLILYYLFNFTFSII